MLASLAACGQQLCDRCISPARQMRPAGTITPSIFLSEYEPRNEFIPNPSFVLPGHPAAGALHQIYCTEPQPPAEGREQEDTWAGI